MTDKEEKWEQLKKKNPWQKEIFNEDTDKLLQEILSEKTKFIHSSDKLGDESKYKLFLLPKPYRGNLKDPKLVILSLNPGYKERVNRIMFKMLSTKYQKQFIEVSKANALLEDGCRIISDKYDVDDVLDNGYWKKQLYDLEHEKMIDSSKIGLIQYVPYASENYDSKDNDDVLGTRNFTKEIIHYLLNETDTLFLIMRSKERWETLIGKDTGNNNKERFLYNKNPRCQKLSRKNLMNGDLDQYEEILNKFKGQ